ncbi:MAG: winged helix-turn-helix domain-containing protein [Acidobacteria bacterium]|nr:winged helix-turn-helix domain-containing protein [Acidobacteriota bacterium]
MTPSQIYEFGPFQLIPRRRLLLRDGETVVLPSRAFDALLKLIEHEGGIFSKDELMKLVWPDTIVGESSLSQLISSIRKALEEQPHGHKYIETDPGRGYRFIAPVRVIMKLEESGEKAAPAPFPLKPSEEIRSLAVLPFRSLNAEKRDEYLELGMADTLITRLSNVVQLVVRPTSAVSKYLGSERDLSEIGAELRVEAVLEGSMYRLDDRLRVTVQMVRVEDGAVLWAAKFDEKYTDIFAVQDVIAEQAAGALALKLSQNERLLISRRDTQNPEAHLAYLKGRYFLGKRNEEGLRKGSVCFRQALDLDPAYAMAWAGLADTSTLLGMLDYAAPHETYPQAKAAAIRALEVDDTLAEAHTSLAQVKLQYDWDWRGAVSEFEKALTLNPHYATAYQWYGWGLCAAGQFDSALDSIRRAQELDPLSLIIRSTMAGTLYQSRRYDEAAAYCRRVIEMDESFYIPHHCLTLVNIACRKYDEAINEATLALKYSGGSPWMIAALGLSYALAGETGMAGQLLEELRSLAATRYVTPFYPAVICAGLNRLEEAFKWFELALEERSGHLIWLKIDPQLDFLRHDPRFESLIRRVGLAAQ